MSVHPQHVDPHIRIVASEHFLRIEFLQSVRTLHVGIRHRMDRMEQRMHGKPDDRSFGDDDFEYSLDVAPGSLPFFFVGPVRTRSMTVSWTFQHINNASMERFSNKIRWLIKQVYGFRTVRNENNRLLRMPQIKKRLYRPFFLKCSIKSC